jgi:hypothetical protein
MIRTLRIFFLTRLLREKLLLVAFMAVAVLIWISGFSTRAGLFWRVQRTTTTELKLQDEWLRNENRIIEAGKQATAQFEASKTLNGNRLFVRVQQLAREAGLGRTTTSQGLGAPVTNGQFSVNTLNFQITQADWEATKKFYLLLSQNAPYIVVDQILIKPSPANPQQLTLMMRVKSFEIPSETTPRATAGSD